MIVVCCQVEVTATGLSLVQRSPTECGVSEYDRKSLDNEKAPAHQRLPKHGKRKLVLKWIINVVCICINPLNSRIKSHLLFAGIIRSKPFSPR